GARGLDARGGAGAPRRGARARRALRRGGRDGARARRAAAEHDRGGAMNAFLAQAPVAWYIARAAGLVAFGLLTLSVWLGLAMSTRLLPAKRTKTLLGLHRTLAWTGLSMLVLHVGALLFDPFLHFNVLSVLVPGAASWKPGAVALGIVAGWLSLALAASFKAKKWIGQKGWRR